MISPGSVIASVLPVYILILIGGLLRTSGVLKRAGDDGIMHLVFHVMLPCFVLDRILGEKILRDPRVLLWGVGLGFSLIVIGIAVSWLAAGLLGLGKGSGKRTFALATGTQNYGFTAIPIVEILFSGGGAMAVLFVHNIGVEIAIWSIGVALLSGERGFPWKRLINGPMIAVAVGMIFVACDTNLTGPLRQAISMLGIGAVPVAIILTGASMVDLLGHETPQWRVVFGSIVVRLGLLPGVFIAAAKFLPLGIELRQVLVVQAAMPAAMMPILLARLYGGRPGTAFQVVLATTIASLLTLPWIIAWGLRWVTE